MSAKAILGTIAGLILFVGLLWSHHRVVSNDDVITIGLLQTASHPALDQVREGFIEKMEGLAPGRVRFVVENAEGSLSQARLIAELFHVRSKVNAIFAIGTPAIQAAAATEKVKPIIIAAVSDPESLGLTGPGTNVCGLTDRVDTEKQADLLQQLLPDARKAAILYHTGEHNSQAMVVRMQRSLESRGLEVLTSGVHCESEIAQAVTAASRRADVILVPTDNLLAGAMPLVVAEASRRQTPLIVSDICLVQMGALAAQGANYRELGRQSALVAHEVLFQGHSPEDVGVADPLDAATVLNASTMETLHLILPKALEGVCSFVRQGGDHGQ